MSHCPVHIRINKVTSHVLLDVRHSVSVCERVAHVSTITTCKCPSQMRRLSGLSESGQMLQANQQQLTTSRQPTADSQRRAASSEQPVASQQMHLISDAL